MSEKRIKIQIDFDERVIARIDALIENENIPAETRPDVLREAVRVYDWLTDLDPETIIEVCDKDLNIKAYLPVKLLRP